MLTEDFNLFIRENRLFQKNHKILVAVSGGIDSSVLCNLMHESGFRFGMAHCNFKLRGSEADADQIFTESLARNYSVSFHTRQFDTRSHADQHGISTQMAARDLRYTYFNNLINKEGYDFVAVGSQLNDNIETLLLNFTRGTGLKGITGMPVQRDHIVRPILFASRERIERYAREHNVSYREDASNRDVKYRRNAIRHNIIPELKKLNPSLENTFAENIKNLSQAEQFIEHRLTQVIESLFTRTSPDETAVNLKLLLRDTDPEFILFRALIPYGFHRNRIADIYESAKSGMPGKQFQSPTHELTIDRDQAFIQRRKKNTRITAQLPAAETVISNPAAMRTKIISIDDAELEATGNKAFLDFDKLTFPLMVRTPKTGDRFKPLGMKGSKKISDFFIDHKVALNKKETIPVVVSNNDIVWVAGFRISEDYKITNNTKRVFVIELISGSDQNTAETDF